MREIQVSYTIFDTFEVPEDWTDEQIQDYCVDRFYGGDVIMEYNDLDWIEV